MAKGKSFISRLNAWIDGDETAFRAEIKRMAPPEKKPAQQGQIAVKRKLFERAYNITSVIVCLLFGGVMLMTVFRLPLFGNPMSPAMNEVVERYVEKGLEETGAVNMVAGMILDYRAFDTFGESSVLFLAITSVMILLLKDHKNTTEEEELTNPIEFRIERESEDRILQTVIGLVLPCILLFGIYVVLNGHLSPGGGFSGGAIMGGGLILFRASFGHDRILRVFTMDTFRKISAAALLTYAASKAYSFFMGANGLETHIPLGIPGAILSSGLIFVLDICVGMVVTCTMYGFYALMLRGDM